MNIHALYPVRGFERDLRHLFGGDIFSPYNAICAERNASGSRDFVVAPAIDIYDDSKVLVVKADLPGVKKEDLEVTFEDGVLSIKAGVAQEKDLKAEQRRYSERSTKAYSRSLELPFKVASDGIVADLKDGVLTIRLPRAEELLPRKIKIEAA